MRLGTYGVAPQPLPLPSLQGDPRIYGSQQLVSSNSWMAPPQVSGGIVAASSSDIRPVFSSSLVQPHARQYSMVSSMSAMTPRSIELSGAYSNSAASGAFTAGGHMRYQSLRVMEAPPSAILKTEAAIVEGGLLAGQAPIEKISEPESPPANRVRKRLDSPKRSRPSSPKRSPRRQISPSGRARSSIRPSRSLSTPRARLGFAASTQETEKRLTRVPDHKMVSVARGQTLGPGPAAYIPKEPQRRITGGGFGSPHRGPRIVDTPGPAAYDVQPAAQAVQGRSRSPGFGIGEVQRSLSAKGPVSPGPLSYMPKEPQQRITGGGAANFGSGHRGPKVPNTPGPADYDQLPTPRARATAGPCFGFGEAHDGPQRRTLGPGPDYSPRESLRAKRVPGATFGSGHKGPVIPKTPGPGEYHSDAAKSGAQPPSRAPGFGYGDAHLGPLEMV